MIEFSDAAGLKWRAELASRGRTSSYLNPKVHGAIVQFTCLDARRSNRYVGYRAEEERPLEQCGEPELRQMLSRAKAH